MSRTLMRIARVMMALSFVACVGEKAPPSDAHTNAGSSPSEAAPPGAVPAGLDTGERSTVSYPLLFDALGFPVFAPYAIKTVKIKLLGNRSYRVPDGDFGNANGKAGYARNGGEPDGYTWHHHQGRQTMQLVPTEIHDAFRHSGGVWVLSELEPKG